MKRLGGGRRFLLRKGGIALEMGGNNAKQYFTLLLIMVLMGRVNFLNVS